MRSLLQPMPVGSPRMRSTGTGPEEHCNVTPLSHRRLGGGHEPSEARHGKTPGQISVVIGGRDGERFGHTILRPAIGHATTAVPSQ